MKVVDNNDCMINLKCTNALDVDGNEVKEELYACGNPNMVIGNLMISSRRYIDPIGTTLITNKTLGITCEIEYIARGWTSDYWTNRVEAVVKDKDGKVRYKMEGYYTTEIVATDLKTGETWVTFKAPEYPENNPDYYFMN